MNSFSWLILNMALLVAAVSSTMLARKIATPELPQLEQEEKSSRDSKGVRAEIVQASREKPLSLSVDDLWEKSLFCPERTERNAMEGDAAETPEQAAKKADFELTGLAWIGLPGESKPVAVIKQQKNQPRSTTRGGRTVSFRGRTVTRRTPQTQPEPEPEKPQNVIFAEGDLINDSGYTLLEINTKENSVILGRGSERVELKIEFGSAASTERKDQAVEEAARRQKEREQQDKLKAAAQAAKPIDKAAAAAANAAVSAAGQPPPPPGPGGIPVTRNPAPPQGGSTRNTAPGAVANPAAPSLQRSSGVPSTQQQRLQQLYRESAERRAKSAQ